MRFAPHSLMRAICLILFSVILLTCSPAKVAGADDVSGESEGNDSRSSGEAQLVSSQWAPAQFVISTLVGIPSGAIESQNERAIRLHLEANFNQLELCNFSDKELKLALETAQLHGMRVMPYDTFFMKENVTDQQIRERLAFYEPHQDIINGFYIKDEPFHDLEVFGLIKQRADLIQAAFPDKLMYINLFPSYGIYTWASETGNPQDSAYVKYCSDFFDRVNPDVLSLDYYIFFDNEECIANLSVNNLWRDWGFFREESRRTGKPFWCYIQSVGIFRNDKGIGGMTAEKIALQMNAAIAYGAKGVSYFNSLASVIDMRAYKTVLFDGVKEVNRQAQLFGNLLLDKEYGNLYHTSMLEKAQRHYYTDRLADSGLLKSLPDNALVATFTDDSDSTYLMIVNRSYELPLQGNIALKSSRPVSMLYTDSGDILRIHEASDMIEVALEAGAAALYIID